MSLMFYGDRPKLHCPAPTWTHGIWAWASTLTWAEPRGRSVSSLLLSLMVLNGFSGLISGLTCHLASIWWLQPMPYSGPGIVPWQWGHCPAFFSDLVLWNSSILVTSSMAYNNVSNNGLIIPEGCIITKSVGKTLPYPSSVTYLLIFYRWY